MREKLRHRGSKYFVPKFVPKKIKYILKSFKIRFKICQKKSLYLLGNDLQTLVNTGFFYNVRERIRTPLCCTNINALRLVVPNSCQKSDRSNLSSRFYLKRIFKFSAYNTGTALNPWSFLQKITASFVPLPHIPSALIPNFC